MESISFREAGATLSSINLLSELSRRLRTALDVEGAFLQAGKLLEDRALRQCLGIVLWRYKLKRKWAPIKQGTFYKCNIEPKETALNHSCWMEKELFEPHIHLKEGKDIIVHNEASLSHVGRLSSVDFLCHPVRVGDEMALSIAVRPLRIDQRSLQEELLLVSAVCLLLKQWIELRFDPREFLAPEENSTPIASYLNDPQTNSISIEEILIHRIGDMVTVFATGTAADKSLYNRIIEVVEKGMIRWALSRTKMIQTDAAQILGINRNTLHTKMKLYGLFSRK